MKRMERHLATILVNGLHMPGSKQPGSCIERCGKVVTLDLFRTLSLGQRNLKCNITYLSTASTSSNVVCSKGNWHANSLSYV